MLTSNNKNKINSITELPNPYSFKDADILVKRIKGMDVAGKVNELNILASKVIVPYVVILIILAAANFKKTSILQFPHLLLGVSPVSLRRG